MGVVGFLDHPCGILQSVITCTGNGAICLRSLFVLITCLVGPCTLWSQSEYQDSVVRAGERSRMLQLEELQQVVFVGCVQTTPQQLTGVISSIPSELSVTRKLTLYYDENLRRNPATPQRVLDRLNDVRIEVERELRYYDPANAHADSIAILTYLDQNGFHRAKVSFAFACDRESEKNTLTFTVREGVRALIDSMVVVGLDSVPEELRKEALGEASIKKGEPFDESAVEASVKNIINVLRDNGYYRASYSPPIVGISADGASDTVVVIVDHGKRVRIDTIFFIENSMGWPSVHEGTRQRQLDIEPGQWYSRKLVEQSRANLMSLGTFEIVLIDTISADSLKGRTHNDSAIVLRVFTRNSKPYDVGMSLLFYQTAVDNFLNLGVGATAQYRNVFGGAQVASVTLQYVLQDISRFAQGQQLETESLASIVLAWPNVGRLFEQRFGIQSSVYYSLRQLVNPFRLESAGFNARAPISLYSKTFFTGIDVNFGLERQVPRNFEGAIDDALVEASTPEDTAYVLSTFNQFLVLNEYLTTTENFLTGINLGLTLRGDHRDNPINPTRGSFASFSIEWGWGAGKYVKSQMYLTTVIPVGNRLTAATKIKLGHIQLLEFVRGDTNQNNTYVPLERQFFAGGPASIRSFPSRQLHDPVSGTIQDASANNQNILSNVVGSGSLIELGFELRYMFEKPRGADGVWASIVERSGFTFFSDIGNSFNRFTTDLYGSAKLSDFLNGSVIAAGIGYRFDTPVGPFRIDYATSIYDPTRSRDKWIFGRNGLMDPVYWQLSIGLGQAF